MIRCSRILYVGKLCYPISEFIQTVASIYKNSLFPPFAIKKKLHFTFPLVFLYKINQSGNPAFRCFESLNESGNTIDFNNMLRLL